MASKAVSVQWKQGATGGGTVYTFYPKPAIRRPTAGTRAAIITVPLMNGVVVQSLSLAERTIEVTGVLFDKSNNWDHLETLRNSLSNGIGTGPGQLHLTSPTRHIYYNAQLVAEGIQFDVQERSTTVTYRFTLIVADGQEHTTI
jgi:hypothetical protein